MEAAEGRHAWLKYSSGLQVIKKHGRSMYIFILPFFPSSRQRLTTHKYFQFCLHSMRITRFVLLLKLNTSKETWQHSLSWQVGGEFFGRRYAPHNTLEMRHCYSVLAERWRVSLLSSFLSRFLVPKSQALGMNRVGWAPVEGRLWTFPEMWYSVLCVATVSHLFYTCFSIYTGFISLLTFLWPLCPLCISSFSAINSYFLKKSVLVICASDGTCRQTFVC